MARASPPTNTAMEIQSLKKPESTGGVWGKVSASSGNNIRGSVGVVLSVGVPPSGGQSCRGPHEGQHGGEEARPGREAETCEPGMLCNGGLAQGREHDPLDHIDQALPMPGLGVCPWATSKRWDARASPTRLPPAHPATPGQARAGHAGRSARRPPPGAPGQATPPRPHLR